MKDILKIENLTVSFPLEKNLFGKTTKKLTALRKINLEVKEGEVMGIVGESGCGKTTLAKAIVGLYPIDKGSIIFAEQHKIHTCKTHDEWKAIRKDMQFIFQDPVSSLDPMLRIEDIILEPLHVFFPELSYEEKQKRIREMMKKVGLSEMILYRFPHELSGGMQQRVMIAMALASNPSILVADEPTTALDVTIQAQILDLLKQLRDEQGMSIILVTHNLGIVAEMADRVCVMYAGRVAETAPVRELLENPQHPYTKALLKAVPVLGGDKKRLSTIPGTVPMPADFPPGCRFCDRCELFSKTENAPCRDKVPPFKEVMPGHFCACHFSGDR